MVHFLDFGIGIYLMLTYDPVESKLDDLMVSHLTVPGASVILKFQDTDHRLFGCIMHAASAKSHARIPTLATVSRDVDVHHCPWVKVVANGQHGQWTVGMNRRFLVFTLF